MIHIMACLLFPISIAVALGSIKVVRKFAVVDPNDIRHGYVFVVVRFDDVLPLPSVVLIVFEPIGGVVGIGIFVIIVVVFQV